MIGDKFKNDRYVRQWLNEIGAKKLTQRNYLIAIGLFCEFTGKLPEALISDAEEEQEKGIPMRRRKIKGDFINYAEWLKERSIRLYEREIAPKTQHNHTTAVKSFYRSFEIELPQNHKKDGGVRGLVENNRRVTKEQVREALKYADVREKAINLVMLSSGLAEGDVLNLKIKDFKDGFDKGTGITTLRLRRSKTGIDFMTFLTPEASQAVLDYVKWRNAKPDMSKARGTYFKGVLMQAYEKRKVRSDDDYLFIKNDVPDEYLPLETLIKVDPKTVKRIEKSKERRENNGERVYDEELRVLGRSGLVRMFRVLAIKAGIDTPSGEWQIYRAHNLRKLFYSLLRNEGLDSATYEFWAGHKEPEAHDVYFEPFAEKQKEIYMRYMEVLSIEPLETKTIESESYKEIKEALSVKDLEIKELKKKLAELENAVFPLPITPESVMDEMSIKIEGKLEKWLHARGII